MDMSFEREFQVIWADIDPNLHMRHSAYYDYAAQMRILFFDEKGFSVEKMAELKTGPILFREEAVFLKEIRMNEKIKVDLHLAAMRKDGSRWTIIHTLYKQNGEKAAKITVDGAWIDLIKRKLTAPSEEIFKMVEDMPKTDTFQFLPEKTQQT
jgi:acyl-CoA thioester hydrolase